MQLTLGSTSASCLFCSLRLYYSCWLSLQELGFKMSVVIVVKVSEGLVLAADSAATLMGKVIAPGIEQTSVLKTFYNARKVLQIGDLPIGVLTWGQAFVGSRTLESLVREWEHDAHWESSEQYRAEHPKESFGVRQCAKGLMDHLAKAHESEFSHLPKEQRPGTGMIVAGYSEGKFFPEVWRFTVPFDDKVHNQRPDRDDGKPDFGASWFGMTDSIVRLHFGRDQKATKVISEKFGIPEAEIVDALAPLQYVVPFAQMPLQDAIDYANYMVNVVIGRFRFVLGPESCGGEVDIAAITQRKFSWISRKSWKTE